MSRHVARNLWYFAVIVTACGTPGESEPPEPASFQGIGDLPGGRTDSGAEDVSNDGTRVVGYSHADDPTITNDEHLDNYGQAALWYSAGTLPGDPRWAPQWPILRPLGYLLPSDNPETGAFGISGDGAVVVGYGKKKDPDAGTHEDQAFRWIAPGDLAHFWTKIDRLTYVFGGGMMLLPNIEGGVSCEAEATTLDGMMVFGHTVFTPSPGQPAVKAACRWTAPRIGGSGTAELLVPEILETFVESAVLDCSEDGFIVVGYGKRPGESETVPLVTAPAEPIGAVLDRIADGSGAEIHGMAHGVSANGNTVVGHIMLSGGVTKAFRWERHSRTLTELDPLPGFVHSAAYAASGNGSRVVGYSSRPSGEDFESVAVIWDSNGHVLSVRNRVELEGGTIPSEWKLLDAHSISKDGRTIVGFGGHSASEGWVARLRDPLP